jgi:hypothetical protein
MSSRHFAKNPLGHPRRTETAAGSDGGIFDQTGEIKNAFKAPPPPTREADCVKPSNLMLRPNGHNTASAARALSMVEAIAAAKPQGSKPTPVPAISSRWTSRLSTTPAIAPAETSSVSDPIVWGDLLEEHVMEHWQETRHRDVEPSQEQSTFDSVRDTAAPAETSPVSEPQATITLSTPLVLVDGQETHDTSFDRSKEESKIDSARTTLSAEPAPVFGPHALETTLPEPLDSDDEHAIANSKIPFNPNADVPVPSTEEARLRDHRALVRQISSRLTRDGDATDDDVAQEIFSR